MYSCRQVQGTRKSGLSASHAHSHSEASLLFRIPQACTTLLMITVLGPFAGPISIMVPSP